MTANTLLPILLMINTACTTMTPSEEVVPAAGASPESMCKEAPAQSLIGRPANESTGAEALRLTGAGTIRWIRPGDAVTMDYRTDRLNIELDAQNRIARLSCG